MPPHGSAHRPVVMGRRGVVTSPHPLASMAGIEMLEITRDPESGALQGGADPRRDGYALAV